MVGFDWAACHTLSQSAAWTCGLLEGSNNNLSCSGWLVKPRSPPDDTSEAASDASSVVTGPVDTGFEKQREPGEGKSRGGRMRNGTRVLIVDLFLTLIYGSTWQVLWVKAEKQKPFSFGHKMFDSTSSLSTCRSSHTCKLTLLGEDL